MMKLTAIVFSFLLGVTGYAQPKVQIGDRFNNFKGKLVILDFWATWCKPCIAMMPLMDSLQKQFADRVQIIPVTYQSQAEVQQFFERYQRSGHALTALHGITGDTTLRKLFDYNTIPHYVWIDANGIVQAFTEFKALTREIISSALSGNWASVPQKKFVPPAAYSHYRPLLINGNGGDGANLLYHSVFTGFTEGLGFGYSVLRDSSLHFRITLKNQPRIWFYRIAFSTNGKTFRDFNTLSEVKDTSRLNSNKTGEDYENWLRDGNGFCYELAIGLNREKEAYKQMQKDLEFLFPEYTGGIEKRMMNCLVLKKTDNHASLNSKGGKTKIELGPYEWSVRNASISNMINRLNFVQAFPYAVVDLTGYTGKIDLDLAAGYSDIERLNAELKKYGLKLEQQIMEQEILVIKDRL
jgi:thiol-disulfide isomerase/thioredoxin